MPFNSFIRSIKRTVDLVFMPFSFKYQREVDYEAYWASRASTINQFNSFQQYRYKWLLKQVEPGTSLLDIGCGDGQLLRMLQSQGIKGTGADVSEYTRNCLSDTDISFIKLDKENVKVCNINSSFDYITMFEFLEHTNNPEDFITHLLQYANKSVMFSIPNSGFISYRIRLLLGKFPRQWKVIHPSICDSVFIRP